MNVFLSNLSKKILCEKFLLAKYGQYLDSSIWFCIEITEQKFFNDRKIDYFCEILKM